MKKSISVSLLAFLFFITTLKAQDSMNNVGGEEFPFHVVELGFRFMPTFSSFKMQTSSSGETVKSQVTLGYGAGALVALNFSRHIGIQGEVIYNSLSQKYKDQGLQHKINIRYINIPLLLSLNTGKSKPVNLNLVVGPQLGLNVGSSISASANPSDTVVAVLVVKKNDWGFAYGAGLEFLINKARTIRLDLGFRGVYGFVNISNTNQRSTSGVYYPLDQATVNTKSGYVGLTFLF
jgi:Outer membrane protein beta-barrel domain